MDQIAAITLGKYRKNKTEMGLYFHSGFHFASKNRVLKYDWDNEWIMEGFGEKWKKGKLSSGIRNVLYIINHVEQ